MTANSPIRRIVCAAIRAADGDVLLGIRHYSLDMHRQIEVRRDGEKFLHRHGDDQGFVDQFGVYLTRTVAHQVAIRSGQITERRPRGQLYSEDLY